MRECSTILLGAYIFSFRLIKSRQHGQKCRVLKGRKKRFVPRPGIEPGTFHLPGGCSTTKLPRPCTFCAVLSVLYCFYNHPWMRRLHWSQCESAQLFYQERIFSHFDLSSLISMARMQSAPKEDSKSFDVPTGDRTGDLSLAGPMV